MSKEIKNSDVELSRELYDLESDQKRKLELEDKKRKTLWGIKAMMDDKEITRETMVSEAIKKAEDRIRELKMSVAYAKSAEIGKAKDKMTVELHDIAEEEAEKARRLLSYLEMAVSAFKRMNSFGFNDEPNVGYIQDKVSKELEQMENAIIDDEAQAQKRISP